VAILGQLVVRNIENVVKARLQRRAKRHGRSMEEEVRDILRNALRSESNPGGGLGSEISALFRDHGLTDEIPELRGHTVHPPEFKA
jgi:antitoxin FitA